MEKQRKTFLSYSRVNKDFALRLAKELKAEGFDVWLDQLDIPAGARWDREVERALKDSEIFMIILTPASIDSENVLDEIGYAIDTGKRFLPVLLERCDIPLRLRRFQYVDFTNKDFDDGVEAAKALLRGLIDLPTLPRMEISSPAPVQAEEEHKAQEEGDRLAAQKVANEQLAQQKAEAERKAKAEARRKAKEDREAKAKVDRLAVQKAQEEQLARSEAERKARIGANRKAKEDADHLAAQKAEAERTSKETTVAAEIKAEPAILTQKKPASKLIIYSVAALFVLAILGIGVMGIGFSLLTSGNKKTPVLTPTTHAAVVPPATKPPTKAPTLVPTPLGGGNGKIAFNSDRDGNEEIYIMNADGSNPTRLTNNVASDDFPAWSPDGKYIAFESTRDEPNPTSCNPCNWEIYIMNMDGLNQTRLTNNATDDFSADWQP